MRAAFPALLENTLSNTLVHPKTFMVANAAGERVLPARQYATFTHYIQGEQFRFVVTQQPSSNVIKVTHRASGMGVAEIPHIALQAAVGDYFVAGKAAFEELVKRVGAARVRSVMAAKEPKGGAQ